MAGGVAGQRTFAARDDCPPGSPDARCGAHPIDDTLITICSGAAHQGLVSSGACAGPRKGSSCADRLLVPSYWPSASRRRRRSSAATSRSAARWWSTPRRRRTAGFMSMRVRATSGWRAPGSLAAATGSGGTATGCAPGPATSMCRGAGSTGPGAGTGWSRAGRRVLNLARAASWTRVTSCSIGPSGSISGIVIAE